MIRDATAMTSADPVDITAIRIKNSIAYSPVEPSSFWATSGAAKPKTQLMPFSSSVDSIWNGNSISCYTIIYLHNSFTC